MMERGRIGVAKSSVSNVVRQAFLSTSLDATPASILSWFVSRWRAETTLQEVRAT